MTQFVDIPCMILAAGRGERMRPLTDETPKPLLKVKGRPLIDWHLQHLHEAGFRSFVINYAWLGQKIKKHIDKLANSWGEFKLSPEESALETAGGIKKALPLLAADDYFFVINGDTYCPEFPFARIDAIVQELRESGDEIQAYLFLTPNPSHHPQGDFCLSGKEVMNKVPERTSYTFSGAGIYHVDLFKSIVSGEVAKLAPILREAMLENQVWGELLTCSWTDVGTPERLEQLNKP